MAKEKLVRGRADPAGAKARISFTDVAYAKIREQILNNEMPAGFQITEQELATRLEVSRTPTREALVRLANEGLIEIWPRHGMRVKHVFVDDLREIYEIITVLEAAACRLATTRGVASGPVIASMRQSIVEMDDALSKDDLLGWAEADMRFHRQLVHASGNRRLIEMVDVLTGQAHRLRMMTLRMRPRPSTSNRDHEDVVDAIARGDAETAERIHRQHRERSGEMLIQLLKMHGISSL